MAASQNASRRGRGKVKGRPEKMEDVVIKRRGCEDSVEEQGGREGVEDEA